MNKSFKRSFAVLLAVLMLVTSVPFAVFAADACDHTFGAWTEYVAATCTEKGVERHTCTKCSTYESRESEAKGHDVDGVAFQIDETPTCAKEGSKSQTCKRCKLKVNVTKIDKTAHTRGQSASTAYLISEATCKQPATYYYYCTVCKEKLVDLQPFTNGEPDPNNHKNTTGIQTAVEATCKNGGQTAGKKCTDCGKVLEEPRTLEKTSHEVGIPATCTTPAVCKFCDRTFGEVNPENHVTYTADGIPHSDIQTDAAISATCTTAGKTEGSTCSKCGTVIVPQTDTDLAPHQLEVIPGVDPTCTKEGSTPGSKCSVCSAVISEPKTIDALGHDETDWIRPENFNCTLGGTVYKDCKREGCTQNKKVKEQYVAPANHMTEEIPEVPATCLAGGKSSGERCSVCGNITKNPTDVPALEHDYSGEAKSNNDGTHLFKCINGCEQYGATASVQCYDVDGDCLCDACGYAVAHQYGEYVSDENATCIQDGTLTRTCSACGATDTIIDEGSKANGKHSFPEDGYVFEEGTATCETDGYEIATCELCKTETDRRIKTGSKLGHVDSEWNYAPDFNCLEGGTRFKLCTVCSNVSATEEIPAGTHDLTGIPEVPATCLTGGKTAGSMCKICQTVVVEPMETPATGHKYNETVITEPTCSQEGSKLLTCEVCGDTQTVTVEKLPHSGEWTVIKEATCTQTGIRTRSCIICMANETEEIPMLAHKNVTDKAVAATCTEPGMTSGTHCSVCGTVTSYQKEVPATGHKYQTVITPATTSKAGKSVKTCANCKKVDSTTAIAKIKSFTLSTTAYVYNGNERKPSVTIKDANDITLKKDTDYTLKYASGRKNVGTYNVVVTFKGKYSGTKALTFTIKPKAPASIKATTTLTSVTLTWGKVTGAAKYEVYMLNSKTEKYEKKATVTSAKATVKSLKTRTKYKFKVLAIDSTGKLKSAYSSVFSVSTATLKAPAKLKATQTTTSITLTWGKVTEAAKYEVYMYNSKTQKYEKKATVTSPKATIKSLTAGTKYKFKVLAIDSTGKIKSPYSSVLTTATKCATPSVTVTSTAKKTVKLSWKKISGATGYTVYYSTKKDGTYKKLGSTTSTTYTNKTLSSAKTYYFKVVANKKVSDSLTVNSANSAVKSVKVK